MRINSWRNILFAATAGLSILYLTWWGRMLLSPMERRGIDFIAFYSAARVAQTHGFASTYHIEYQREIEQEVLGFPLGEKQVLLYNHMPYLIPLLVLIVDHDYVASFVRWVLILLFLYFIGTQYFLKSLFAERQDLHIALFASVLTFFPLFTSVWQGQDTVFLYLGVGLWCAGFLKKKDWLVAAGLALTTIRPHISIALAVPLLLKYQRAWYHSLLLIGGLALISFIILNPRGVTELLNMLRITSLGEWFGMKPEAMLNLLGLLIRVVKFDAGTALWVGWLIYLSGLTLLWYWWWRSKEVDHCLLGLSILIIIITAPHLHLHDLTVLIFPLLFIAYDRTLMFSEPRWILLPVGASLMLLIGIVFDVLYFILPYVLFFGIAWLLLNQQRSALAASIHDAE